MPVFVIIVYSVLREAIIFQMHLSLLFLAVVAHFGALIATFLQMQQNTVYIFYMLASKYH